MTHHLRRFKIELEDQLRYSPRLREALALGLLTAHRRAADGQELARRLVKLCSGARLTASEDMLTRIEASILRCADALEGKQIDWSEFIPGIGDGWVEKGVVIKPWVSPREKGAVFISFENQWVKLLTCRDMGEFARRYDLIVSPTWCPPHGIVNVLFPRLWPDPVYSLISNQRDLCILPRLSQNYVMIPLYASSWVNPSFFQPRPRNERDIDIVMIANWAKYKRHHVLFRALRQMPPGLRVVLIGTRAGSRTADNAIREANLYGVANRVTIHGSMPHEFVADMLGRARISLILSRREGSCVAVAESMFADTPVGLLKDSEIGSGAFINPATGCFLEEGWLADGIMAFLQNSDSFSPRQWACSHIRCGLSTALLNQTLKEHALAAGRDWSRDIAPLHWHPDPELVDRQVDWLQPERRRIEERFGISIGR